MLFGALFLLTGLGAIGIALHTASRTRRFLALAREARGEVLKLVRHHGSWGTTHHPVVRFQTAEGVVTEFTSPFGTRPSRFKVGDRVPVLYDPNRPSDARIHTPMQVWMQPVLFGFVGGVFALVGAIALLRQLTG